MLLHSSRPVLSQTRKGGSRKNKKNKLRNSCLQILLFATLFYVLGTMVYHGITLYSIEITTTTDKPIQKDKPTTTVLRRGDTKQTIVETKAEEEESVDSASSSSDSIGYVISITGCPGERQYSLYDGAAVLKHSIDLVQEQSKYKTYKLHAFVHRSAVECSADLLKELEYDLKVVDLPVEVHEIENAWTRTNIVKGGCCNEKELIKLFAYTLKEHSIVVHLDVDTLIMKPLDPLFDTMIQNDIHQLPSHYRHLEQDVKKKSVDFLFTRDYNMATSHTIHVGVQGGFFLIKPSEKTFSQFVNILRKGHYTPDKGWGNANYGPFYGSMTIQGLLPYFYDHVQKKQTSLELNRCYVNNMSDNPRENPTVNNVVSGQCKDFRDDCMDCRTVPIDQLFSVHYTVCYKPWTCSPHTMKNLLQHGQCYDTHAKWFQIRHDFQTKHSLLDTTGENTNFMKDHFLGYCTRGGEKGYVPIPRFSNT